VAGRCERIEVRKGHLDGIFAVVEGARASYCAWMAFSIAKLVVARIEQTLYYYALRREHWRCLRTNNPPEPILREVGRKGRAVGTLPDANSAKPAGKAVPG